MYLFIKTYPNVQHSDEVIIVLLYYYASWGLEGSMAASVCTLYTSYWPNSTDEDGRF